MNVERSGLGVRQKRNISVIILFAEIFRNGLAKHGGNNATFRMMTSTLAAGILCTLTYLC